MWTWCRQERAVWGIRCTPDLSASWKSCWGRAQTSGTSHTRQTQRRAAGRGSPGSRWSHAPCWARPGPSCSPQELGLGTGPPCWRAAMGMPSLKMCQYTFRRLSIWLHYDFTLQQLSCGSKWVIWQVKMKHKFMVMTLLNEKNIWRHFTTAAFILIHQFTRWDLHFNFNSEGFEN